jgi:peptidyl-prolyl cis-trans isomerase C
MSQSGLNDTEIGHQTVAEASRAKKWPQLLSEPLVHFVIAGAILFGGYRLFNKEPEVVVEQQQIEITADDVRQLAVSWLAQGRPPPTADQLRSLIDQKIIQEVLFREGLALGLDRDDEIIKRRLAQKMDFLAADVASMEEPSNTELLEWFSKNSVRFATPPHASFRHLYFSPDKRGNATRGDATSALGLVAGQPAGSPEVAAVADPFMSRSYYTDSTPDQMVKEFGPAFAAELFKLEPGSWRGPVQSGYGWHLVWIDSMKPGRVPAFEEVEADVRSAWVDSRYQEVKRSALEEMRSRYKEVVVPLDTVDLSDLNSPNAVSDSAESFSQ